MDPEILPDFGPLNFTHKRSIEAAQQSSTSNEPSSSEMDPEVARNLFENGAFLIFLDVPPRTEFGVDCNSWNVGEKFKGIKMIPPGIHFIHYSAISRDGITSLRTGFFHNFKPKEVLVKRWDALREGLSENTISSEEQERFELESNLKSLDPFLGAYPYGQYKKWVSLSRWITEKTLRRLVPLGPHQSIFSVQQLESNPFSSSRSSKSEHHLKKLKPSTEDLPEMKVVENTRIRFVPIPSHLSSKESSVAEITESGMDKSLILERLIKENFDNDPKEVVAEISFAFICFLVGQVFDAFEQWKKLIALLCGCEKLILKRPEMFVDFITMLYYQLHEIPKDFFVDIVTQENFLTNTLQRFFATIESLEDVNGGLKKKTLQFREHLQKYFKWDFSSEMYEDAPVVVEL